MFSNDLVCEIIQFLNLNINRKVTMQELSNTFFFHKDYLMRLFKRELHCTIIMYMNKVRIYESLKDLQFSDESLLRIGLHHGFYSLEYYSAQFHSIMGVSPTIYRVFSRRLRHVSDKDMLIIQQNLAKLSSFFEFVTFYLGNRKKILSKNLSIFK